MVSPKWQTMWVESQHCSKNIVNVPLPSLQARKILEDLRTSCCSPNKAVQVEALKCWGLWIHNQSPDEWKLNTVCFTAVRPLITKKLQPLHKDVDVCKLKLSLMWALLVKVQNMMQLEGPQYILEVFLQSCLTWLSSSSEDGSDDEVSLLIFQLLLAVFDKSENLTGCDIEMFPPLSSDVLHLKKVFHLLADKFLNIFIYWRKVKDKTVILKIWKHFLEHCESSHEHIPIPVWHKVFKLVGQICAEKDEPVKERLAFLHSCATTLKSALSSSKFIDFGNLLTTPCEVLLKKLVELSSVECDEFPDWEMFCHSKEICQALSGKSVAIGGYDLCIGVLDVLEEFYLRSLFWGVWCGLAYCYNSMLKDTHHNQLTKTELKFYRKLRGVTVNFELDRNDLHEDCIKEVEKHIGFLRIDCLRLPCAVGTRKVESFCRREQSAEVEPIEVKELGSFSAPECDSDSVSKEIVSKSVLGQFAVVPFRARKNLLERNAHKFNFDLIKNILSTLSLNSRNSLLGSTASIRFISMRSADCGEMGNSLEVKVEVSRKEEVSLTVCCREAEVPPPKLPCTPVKRRAAILYEVGSRSESQEEEEEEEQEVISTPTTRSRKRAEEEKKREVEMQRRRKRKSFEVLVQEIVRKNKERKTEKNDKTKKTSDALKSRRRKKKMKREVNKENERVTKTRARNNKPLEVSDRKLRNAKKEAPAKDQSKKEKNSMKKNGKLENYFKVVTKKSGNDAKKEAKKPPKTEKSEKTTRKSRCCNSDKKKRQEKGEIGWKQTSLKTMMNAKSKMEKTKKGGRTREKTENVSEEKKTKEEEKEEKAKKTKEEKAEKEKKTKEEEKEEKAKKTKEEKAEKEKKTKEEEKEKAKKIKEEIEEKEKKTKEEKEEKEKKKAKSKERKMLSSPLAKISPFMEVFHDHEYAKMEPREMETMERILSAKKEKRSTGTAGKEKPGKLDLEKMSKPNRLVTETIDCSEKRVFAEEKTLEVEKTERKESENVTAKAPILSVQKFPAEKSEVEKKEVPLHATPEEFKMEERVNEEKVEFETAEVDFLAKEIVFVEETSQKSVSELSEKKLEVQLGKTDVQVSENRKEFSGNESTPEKSSMKRVRTTDSPRPSKRIKHEEEEEEEAVEDILEVEKLPVEITEKENLEKRQPDFISPTKKERNNLVPKSNGSPNGAGGGMSRALRIIGLVPESTKGRSWDSSPKVEALKCKKAPNVDRNSRASKMLALLFENVVEAEEVIKLDEEEVDSVVVVTTPNSKTPSSSLKSPKSIKKRKSIRFDDAKNETVLYEIDTPPSKILEEKEKRRGAKPFEMGLHLP